MRKNIFALALMVSVLSLSGCSSGEKTEEDLEELYPEELPVEEAATDAVPEEEGTELASTSEEPASEDAFAGDFTEDSFAEEGETTFAESEPVSEPEATPEPYAAEPQGGMGESFTYNVRSGDTLMKIAFEVYGDIFAWRKIYEMNQDRIGDYNQLTAGMSLRLERPATAPYIEKNGNPYLIKTGDTLGSISTDVYGTPSKWRSIYENNRQLIKDPNRIYAGFTLYYVPSVEDPYQPQPLGDAGAPPSEASRTPANESP